MTFVNYPQSGYSGAMNDLNPLAVAKQPTQLRAVKRFDRVVAEAEALLIEKGLSGFSIPLLAERLRYTRGSVYVYFPTHYAILNELASRYLAQLEGAFQSRAAELARMNLREAIEAIIDQAISFYKAHPVAALLILGGAVTDDSYRAQEMTNQRLGNLGRALWQQKGLVLPTVPADIATLAVDIGTACMRRSYFAHGKITRAYRDAAIAAMVAFLGPYAKALAAPRPARPKAP